ncbi:hypothetical protein [Hymenobacter cellulosilyticus]|uniref:HEAT repeat domain-containing protein n=1 Tax=Hymenobacter cellulosilyticus TaxID=2932248 RepID=A0A8T9Q5R9_9BACT|nr:hypothetical protein [Hymenobacter cellulosilyticus]UOQ71771.1 hypothetical protein MUN79_24730 [Hymenobacter cellulosilyticus]
MRKKDRLARLKAAVFSGSREAAYGACQALYHFGGGFSKTAQRRCHRFLVSLLDHEDAHIRNAAALTFRHNRASWAVAPLLCALHNPANLRSRGTLAYALEQLNCRRHLGSLFRALFGAAGNSWEVQMHILTILETQTFTYTPAEIRHIQQQWESLKLDWNRLNNIPVGSGAKGALDEKLIQQFVDQYAAATD